jgi:hypothetical protein
VSRFAEYLGVSERQWSNTVQGLPLGLELAKIIVKKCPGVTLDWLCFGHIGGLTVRMVKILVALDGKDGVQ